MLLHKEENEVWGFPTLIGNVCDNLPCILGTDVICLYITRYFYSFPDWLLLIE
jgi:hypothetical protein